MKQTTDLLEALVTLKTRYAELDEDHRARLKTLVILNSADPVAVVTAADLDGDDWAHLYPAVEPRQVNTSSAIDTFLETYGHASPEEDALLERLIFNPTPDYAGVLEAQAVADDNPAPAPDDLTSSRIDSFMSARSREGTDATQGPDTHRVEVENVEARVEQPTPHADIHPAGENTIVAPRTSAAKVNTQSSSLNESLAKIYIKQGRYRRAYEILSDLNLKYPEKSVYFADQLRFLKKLIMLQERTPAVNTPNEEK